MIRFTDISLRRGSTALLQDVSVTLYANEKIGLIGANGSGKSSLFAFICGKFEADSGSVDIPKNLVIASVAQETPALEQSAIEFVLDGDQKLRQVQQQLQMAEENDDANLIADGHSQLHDIDGYSAHARAAQLLAGLGFGNKELDKSVADFSGGWRMRLNLAQALMSPSDLLLLDEPTNHLDLDAIIWLEGWLRSYQGTLVLISHDRDFIDATVDRILHIERQQVFSYSGNYSEFERQRAEKMLLQQKAYDKQQTQISHMQKFVDRFGAKASKAKQAQSRVKALERMTRLEAAYQDSAFRFNFTIPNALPNPLIQLESVNLGYGQHTVLKNVNIGILAKCRIGLLGPNGAGKSTLIKVLAQRLKPLQGDVHASAKLKVGYFDQHQVDSLDLRQSPLELLQENDKLATESALRKHLGRFNFSNDMALSPITHFSGGEKARVALAILVWQKPNLLLLDEPTNHLDLNMRRALNFALQSYEGSMLIVSHDRHLLRASCDEFLLIANNKVDEFKGDLDDYKTWLFEYRKQLAKEGEIKQPVVKEVVTLSHQERARLNRLVKKSETELDKIEQRLNQINEKLNDENSYRQENHQGLQEILKEQKALNQKRLDVEQAWLESMQALGD